MGISEDDSLNEPPTAEETPASPGEEDTPRFRSDQPRKRSRELGTSPPRDRKTRRTPAGEDEELKEDDEKSPLPSSDFNPAEHGLTLRAHSPPTARGQTIDEDSDPDDDGPPGFDRGTQTRLFGWG